MCSYAAQRGTARAGGEAGAEATDALECDSERPRLVETPQGLSLVAGGQVVRADFSRLAPRLRADRLSRELLVRAVRVKGATSPTAIDATAGLGEDALLIAAVGFSVHLYERDSTIAALLADGLRRAREDELLGPVARRMRLTEGDAIAGLHSMAEKGEVADVVYLDPMFPAKRKHAAPKKKLQMIQRLERPCEDEEALFAAARGVGPRKVVVKRPIKGAWLAQAKPAYTLAGKAIRYDVYV